MTKTKKKKKELQWGETAWDNMSKDELLKEVWRMFLALQSAQGTIRSAVTNKFWHRAELGAKDNEEVDRNLQRIIKEDGYWGGGVGGACIEEIRQALWVLDEYTDENMYRSFFRYAKDLLFERTHKHLGTGWAICPKCGTMLGDKLKQNGTEESHIGKPCEYGETDCDGIFRALEWSDLRQTESEQNK